MSNRIFKVMSNRISNKICQIQDIQITIVSNSYVVAKQLIKEAEGFRKEVYNCSMGYSTIGYGHKLLQHEINKLNVVTLEQAEQLLQQEMQDAIDQAMKEFQDCWNKIGENRQAVIIDMVNLGSLTHWIKFKAALVKGEYHEAAKQIMDSKYAKQVGNRAKRNAHIMRDGIKYTRTSQNWNE